MEHPLENKILLTGASGHLGYVIHKMLSKDGMAHRVFLRKQVDYIEHDDVVIGSLYDPAGLRKMMRGCTSVIHCAGKVWPRTGRNQHVIDVNYGITKLMVKAAIQEGVKQFVYISSIHSMVESTHKAVLDESAELVTNDRLPYDFSKAESERFLSEQGDIDITILNPTGIIGPGDHYFRGMNQMFKRLLKGQLPVNVSGGFNIVDVRDVAHAAIESVRQMKPGKYMLGGEYITMADLAAKYGQVNSVKTTKWIIPPWIMRLAAWLSVPIERMFSKPFAFNQYSVNTLLGGHQNISSEKARRELGFKNLPLEDTLRALHRWLVSNKMDF